MKNVKSILALLCLVVAMTLSSCSATDFIDSLPFFEDNTTVSEAVQDSQKILSAIRSANADLKSRNTTVYGDKILSEGISYKDVIDKNDLKSAAETKRYDGKAYHLYWDNNSKSPFWTTDGKDDIRNADGANITHEDSKRIVNNTPVNELQ
ncbi:MAG: hypothetical protein U0M12_06285 [Acutalibacteraceae bacterium]|nr:hypothetical protein [Acutalibacteraceae bacterium]